MKKLSSAADLERLRKRILSRRDPEKICISVCGGTGCHAYNCEEVVKALRKEIRIQGLNKTVELKQTGCHGFCERGPLIVLHPKKIFYQRVSPDDVSEIIAECCPLIRIPPGRFVECCPNLAQHREKKNCE